jgi:hypothetical protein
VAFLKTARALLALAILLASALPWLDIGETDVRAFADPALALSVEAPAMLWLWAVPLQALLVLALGAAGRPTRFLAFGLGATPLVALAVISLVVRNGLYPVLGLGFYAAAAPGLALCLEALGVLGRPSYGLMR